MYKINYYEIFLKKNLKSNSLSLDSSRRLPNIKCNDLAKDSCTYYQ